MPNYLRALAALCVALAFLTACSGEPPTVGEATPFGAVCSRDNDGQRVAVDGYLSFPNSFTEARSVVLRMHETDAFVGAVIGVQVPFGSEVNQLEEVADQFTDDDLRLHLSDGTTTGFGTKVTISGKVYFPIVEQEFTCALENPLVELADKTASDT